jgi:hypothetical protein
MGTDKKNLFLTLLKLKSYLASMIDEQSELYNNFNYSKEYLDRRYPDKSQAIINLLEENEIYTDAEITFNDKIIYKFRAIANKYEDHVDLLSLLDKLEIEARDTVKKDGARKSYISEREKRLSEILDSLFQLATNWAVLKELEDKVDDYSILDEEDIIRPDEEKNLNTLDDSTDKAFAILSDLTKKYLGKLTDYYFCYGGDLALKEFVEELDDVKKSVIKKYSDLFKSHGLDSDWIEKFSE